MAMNGALVSYCIQTLRLCAFPIASAVLGPVMLAMLPQGIEVLRTMSDTALADSSGQPDEFGRVCFFLVSLVVWSLANWYGARMLVQRQFGYPVPAQASPFARRWRTGLPRALIVLGWFPIALTLARIGELKVAAASTLCCGAALTFATYRRALLRWLSSLLPRIWPSLAGPGAVGNTAAGAQRAQIPEGELLTLVTTGIGAVIGLVTLSMADLGVARMLGAAALLLLALAMWTLALTVLLVYLPKASGWPALTGVAVLAALLFANLGWTANHGIASRRVDADEQTRVPRPEAFAYWEQWRVSPLTPTSGPIYLVAAEGGASRSAWWTGHVLSVLDDVTQGDFGRRTFAVSGVSGGSLGLATWVALRKDLAEERFHVPDAPVPDDVQRGGDLPSEARDWGRAPDVRACEVATHQPTLASVRSACFLGGDFVSTVLAYLLGADLLQRITPAPIAAWDRSIGLETTWSRDWRLSFGSDHFARPLVDLYAHRVGASFPRTDLPLLLLNTTSAVQGRPMVQALVRIPSPEVDDLLDPALRTSGLTLAGAVHNSARFPYVSPGGDVLTADGQFYDSVVDGGYVENSGALGLATLIRVLRAQAEKQGKVGDLKEFLQRVVVIFIANDPDEPVFDTTTLCTKDASALNLTPRAPWGELGTPPLGLYQTRSGRAGVERRALIRELDLCPQETMPTDTRTKDVANAYFISMGSPMVKEFRPAMSWFMRFEARDTMWRAVATDPASREIQRLLRQWATEAKADEATAVWRLSRFGVARQGAAR